MTRTVTLRAWQISKGQRLTSDCYISQEKFEAAAEKNNRLDEVIAETDVQQMRPLFYQIPRIVEAVHKVEEMVYMYRESHSPDTFEVFQF